MTEDRLREMIGCLQGKEYVAELEDGKIKISVNVETIDIVLWCSLSKHFPYEIPRISIDEESMKILPKMPHVYTSNGLCIFDKSRVIPNFNEPLQLLLDTIDEAIKLIRKGIRGENNLDYIDEFLEYWSTATKFRAEMYVEQLAIAKPLYWCFKKEGLLICDSDTRLQEVSNAIDSKTIDDDRIYQGILIPISGENITSIPKNDKDIIKMIEENSQYNKQYNSFMQKNIDKSSLVVFNLITSEKNMLAGWIHWGPGVPSGFRKGHVSLAMAYGISKKKGTPVNVENCHQNRLFTRGGDGSEPVWKKVGIIGCGSVGSFVADALKTSGAEKFVLVDNEKLEYENIARHASGYFWVGHNKTFALGFDLQKWNSNIVYEPYNENAHDFVEDHQEVINECDVLFVAVASVPVEHHINRLIIENKITIPVVFIWVEPYSLGGHAILLKEPQDLYRDVFDEDTLQYKNSIVQNGSDYLKREAGCQSTYMPYSGFLLQQFVYRVLEQIMSVCCQKRGNYRLTWCGRLSDAKQIGVEICDEYKNVEDFSLITERID
ncbi:MAG: ThiF family adenylyltransferase [Tyzzerella sp.]|nr:ThiF family adenylyltransferase [Tyzzerella sp.]